MHAVILRNANQVLLRAYTVPIEVNGNLTAETLLHVGDYFTLGSYQFELVHTPDVGMNRDSGKGSSDQEVPSTSLGEAFGESSPVEVDSLGAPSGENAFSMMSRLLDGEFRESGSRASLSKRPVRLSFVGGVEYVSEAVQSSFTFGDGPKTTLELSQKATQRLQADQLRREIAAWRNREQKWKEQDAQTRSELSDAIARFHQSQQQAEQASDAVKQLRKQISQLTEEMESLAKESASYREKAERAKERYRKSVDAASEARDEAIRQRDDAEVKNDHSSVLQIELIRERDLLRQERDAAVAERNNIVSANQNPAEEVRKTALYNAELAKMSEEFAAQQVSLAVQREELQSILKANDEQARKATDRLAQAQVQIEGLLVEVSKHQEALTARHQSSEQAKREYETLIEELSTQVSRLEADYAAVCEQLSSAATDSGLVDSLNARLSEAESRRGSEKLSSEQAAKLLHTNIQQLSIELASATTQLSQKEVEHEATQAELNSAYDRLTSVRRELAARPTTEQWEDLQKQLVETEQQLATTEQQIIVLRREYDHSRTISVAQNAVGRIDAMPIIAATPLPTSLPNAEPSKTGLGVQANDPQRDPTQTNDDLGDHGWPTYGVGQDGPFDPIQDSALNLIDASESVADRLSSYTSHEKAQRLWHAPLQDDAQGRFDTSNAQVEVDVPEQTNEQRPSSFLAEEAAAEEVVVESPTIGFFAKQLIAEPKTDHPSISPEDESLSVSQSLGSWVNSPTRWQQSDELSMGVTDAKDQPLNPLESFRDSAFTDSQSGDGSGQTQQTPQAWDTSFHRSETDSTGPEEFPFHVNWSSGNELPGAASLDTESEPQQDESEHTYMLADMPLREIIDAEAMKQFDFSVSLNSSQVESSGRDSRLSSESNLHAFDFQSEVVESDQVSPAKTYAVIEPAVEDNNAEPAPDDDSIEAYMNRLLQRVQGHSSPQIEKATQPSAATSPYSQPTSSTKTVNRESTPTANSDTTSKPSEVIDPNTPIVPRSQAPEDAGHLAAMRELSNATANSAISQSVRGQAEKMKSKAIVDLVQAGVVLGCAFAFYTCGEKIPSLQYVWFTAAALAVALSVFFVLDMLKKLSAAKMTYDDISEQPDHADAP